MPEQKQHAFREKLSPFLKEKLQKYREEFGEDSEVVKVIKLQYMKDPREDEILEQERKRHYEADMYTQYGDRQIRGVEKLYRRVILVEPTTVCLAHCRWCLRANYPVMNLSEEELITIAKYFGDRKLNAEVREVLITGGDPLMIPDRLDLLIDSIVEYAPNVQIIRIGSRLPVQEPSRINDRLLHALRRRKGVRFELGTQVNHVLELFPEVKEAFTKIKEIGYTIYNQTVLLKGLNDNFKVLVELFDELRHLGIETHYLFHCVPLKGMHHHRTSVEKGVQLIRAVTSCGQISGRCKPMYTLMTDIGKITLYEGAILKRDATGKILVQSNYSLEERKRWNPSWQLPDSVIVDENGLMRVWYLDGSD